MYKINDRLFIGSDADCNYRKDTEELEEPQTATIHACKTCHQKALNYKGNLDSNNGAYLVYEQLDNLFLNIVDMDTPLLHRYMFEITKAALDFIERKIKQGPVIIHCNKGESRAPSFALMYLAKRSNVISNVSFFAATQDFLKLFPRYNPSPGLAIYLENHWEEIV